MGSDVQRGSRAGGLHVGSAGGRAEEAVGSPAQAGPGQGERAPSRGNLTLLPHRPWHFLAPGGAVQQAGHRAGEELSGEAAGMCPLDLGLAPVSALFSCY